MKEKKIIGYLACFCLIWIFCMFTNASMHDNNMYELALGSLIETLIISFIIALIKVAAWAFK